MNKVGWGKEEEGRHVAYVLHGKQCHPKNSDLRGKEDRLSLRKRRGGLYMYELLKTEQRSRAGIKEE